LTEKGPNGSREVTKWQGKTWQELEGKESEGRRGDKNGVVGRREGAEP